MLRTKLRTCLALGILVTAMGFVLAQQPREGEKRGAPSLRAKNILGSKVQLQGDTQVGSIEDIVFDDEGVIDYFIVSEGGKFVTVPWEAAKFNFEKRTAVINISAERFRKIPTFTSDRYPEFYTPAYQTEIYGYYDLKPGQSRRLERRMNRK